MVDNRVTLTRTLLRYQRPGRSNTATQVSVTILSLIQHVSLMYLKKNDKTREELSPHFKDRETEVLKGRCDKMQTPAAKRGIKPGLLHPSWVLQATQSESSISHYPYTELLSSPSKHPVFHYGVKNKTSHRALTPPASQRHAATNFYGKRCSENAA